MNSYQGNRGMDDTQDFDNINDSSRIGLVNAPQSIRGKNLFS